MLLYTYEQESYGQVNDIGVMTLYQYSRLPDDYDYTNDIVNNLNKLCDSRNQYKKIIHDIHILVKDKPEFIPQNTCYCYGTGRRDPCPYWTLSPFDTSQSNGVCMFMNSFDSDDQGLLWDQVKECGISDYDLADDSIYVDEV